MNFGSQEPESEEAQAYGGKHMRLKSVLLLALATVLTTALAGLASAESAAERAVKEAQKYKGQTITIVWEAGLQSLDPLNFSQQIFGVWTVCGRELPHGLRFFEVSNVGCKRGRFRRLSIPPRFLHQLFR